jgi:hypothetical protein
MLLSWVFIAMSFIRNEQDCPVKSKFHKLNTVNKPNRQNLLFLRRHRVVSSVGLEHYLDRVGVTGSTPVQPT